ncbi:hypothetical protein CLAIMM_06354 [Cladophialophora immunda]|nr:hypothetical protein CLAIMM_06354 [Cladophialophora immunda]
MKAYRGFPRHSSPRERTIKAEDDEYDSYESDSDFGDDDDGREVLKKSTHHLAWPRITLRNGSRGMPSGNFIKTVFVRDDDKEIHITVSADDTAGETSSEASGKSRLLGYIRFQSKQGTLELTNFNAKLERKHLDLGETSKRNNNALAGGHGEGFKLAALAMRRNGHSVKFETNSFCWSFSFRGTRPRLVCLLDNPPPKLMREQEAEFSRQWSSRDFQRRPTPYIWEDMTVKIGKSRDRQGAQKVSGQDFRAWIRVSLDLDPPQSTEIVHTNTGDLIFDPRYRGRIYLHGLLIPESAGYSQGGKGYRFGYNFYHGQINRDRQRMADTREEARTLASIWNQAILLKGDSVIDAYIKLLTEDEEAADIAQAYKHASRLTAQHVCRRLKDSHPEAFFYSHRDASEQSTTTDEEIILKELKKRPRKLEKNLWWIIRQEPPLMRSPIEERNHLFQTSQPVQPGNDVFSLSIIRGLTGSFALDPRLSKVRIEFVDGADTAIDVLYKRDRDLLQVHAKWLDVAQVHQVSSCEFFKVAGEQMTNENAFLCDHVIHDLLEVAFDEVRGPLDLAPATAACLRRNAVEYLRKMPRAIEMRVLDAGKKLKVKWAGNESGAFTVRYGANIHYWVTLHEERLCGRRKTQILNAADQAEDLCNCPTQTVSQAHSEVVFDGLDPSEQYFPMVSRAETPAFYGLPPSPSDYLSESDQESSFSPDPLEEESDWSEDSQVQVRGSKVGARSKVVALDSDSSEDSQVQKDEQDWLEWHQQYRQSTHSRDSPPLYRTFWVHAFAIPALYAEDLDLTLERDYYYRVLLEGEETEQVIFVHKIVQNSIQPGDGYSLFVTRYSALSSVFPTEKPRTTGDRAFNDQEVILHFYDFDKMRTPQDAETILLDNILSARRVGTGRNSISHVVQPCPDVDSEKLFCRFGISNAGGKGGVTEITPLASHLLLHHADHWERRGFRSQAAAVAYDLTPSVLGVAEGFAGRGFMIQAAFGLDESKHHTWMNRHLAAQYFDGAIPEVFEDFASGKLLPIQLPDPATPKIHLFAGEHACFRLSTQNRQMPTLHEFLKPLDAVDKAVEALNPDFVVMLLPPAVRHPQASSRFSKTLLKLLEAGFSVHSTLISLRDYGLPQERSILAIIASPFGVPLPWKFEHYVTGAQVPTTIGSLIGDLAFENPRMGTQSNTGFVCLPPTLHGPEAEMSTLGHVYNHYTGIPVASDAQSVSMDGNTPFTFFNGQKEWIHPVRKDRVTVRELARMQGIPDELRFFGSREEQYDTVCKAIPPIITKMIAHTIREAIENSRVVVVRAAEGHSRRSKRARVEEDEEDQGGN